MNKNIFRRAIWPNKTKTFAIIPTLEPSLANTIFHHDL